MAVRGLVTIVLLSHRGSHSVDWLFQLVSDWAEMRVRDELSKFPIVSVGTSAC